MSPWMQFRICSAIDRKVTQPGAFVMGYDAPGDTPH